MREAVGRTVRGRGGVVTGIVALVAALSGSAIALPGKNTVDSGDIENGQVRSGDVKNGDLGSREMKIAYIRINGSGKIVRKFGVKSFVWSAPNVLCLDLKFKPKTGSATRGTDAGNSAEPSKIPFIGVPPAPAQTAIGCHPPVSDAVLGIAESPDLDGTYANFIG